MLLMEDGLLSHNAVVIVNKLDRLEEIILVRKDCVMGDLGNKIKYFLTFYNIF